MTTVVFFLEGPSEKEMLIGLLPRLLSRELDIRYLVFRGKQDLEKHLIQRMQGWRIPNSIFIVLRDQDFADCRIVKAKLHALCRQTGKAPFLIRIACRELESFYLGDLAAVEQGLGLKGLQTRQRTRKFRNPDELANPAEELMKLTGNRYDKLSGSRAIAPHLDFQRNQSHSFKVLVDGIRRLVDPVPE